MNQIQIPNSFKDLLSTKVYKTGIESQQQILKRKFKMPLGQTIGLQFGITS